MAKRAPGRQRESTRSPAIAISSGEPAGIGPDICLMLAARPGLRRGVRMVLVGDADMFARRARRLGLPFNPAVITPNTRPRAALSLLHVPLARRERPGSLDCANAGYVLAVLDAVLAGCVNGAFDAMVTAPVHKAVINDAGIPFTGHTEYLADKTGTAQVVMLLVGGKPVLRVALATTHLALRAVADAIVAPRLTRSIEILAHDLRSKFGIARPRILVAGLNPHAGESGHMGREEIDVIIPVLTRMRRRGFLLDGPLPADTLFTPGVLAGADAVLAMYHDQGLPVLKFASFGHGINLTLGLPVIRTSVDHGTALDLAGSLAKLRGADPGSLAGAFRLAAALARRVAAAATAVPKAVPKAATARSS